MSLDNELHILPATMINIIFLLLRCRQNVQLIIQKHVRGPCIINTNGYLTFMRMYSYNIKLVAKNDT